MKRSVLIVVCDFLVLSALSLIGGHAAGVFGPASGSLSDQQGYVLAGISEWTLDPPAGGQQWEERYGSFDEYLVEESEKKAAEALRLKAQAEAEAMRLEQEKAAAEARTTDTEKELASKQKEAEDAHARAARLEAEKTVAEARTAAVEGKLQSKRREAEQAKAQAALLAKGKMLAEAKINETTTILTRKQQELEQAMLTAARVQAQAIRLAKEKELDKTRIRQAHEQAEYARAEAERLAKEKNLVEARITQVEKQLKTRKGEVEQAKSVSAAAQAQVARLTEEKEKIKARADKFEKAEQALVEAKQDLRDLKKQLEKYTAKKDSAWTKPEAWRELRVSMREEDLLRTETYQQKVTLPIVRAGGNYYAVGEFASLGLAWHELVRDGNIVHAEFALSKIGKSAVLRRASTINVLDACPQVCLIPCPEFRDRRVSVYEPIGIGRLRQMKHLSGIYRFRKTDPDNSEEVSCSLGVTGEFMIVKRSLFLECNAERGDYLITRTGEFVGVMISPEKCWIFPTTIKLSKDVIKIPAAKPGAGEDTYETFVRDATQIWKKTKLGSRGQYRPYEGVDSPREGRF